MAPVTSKVMVTDIKHNNNNSNSNNNNSNHKFVKNENKYNLHLNLHSFYLMLQDQANPPIQSMSKILPSNS